MFTESLLVLLSVTVFCVFLGLSIATVGIAVWKRRADRRNKRALETVQGQLFERRDRSDVDWRDWLTSLSEPEQTALKSLLQRYLRVIEGPKSDRYLEIADTLALPQAARWKASHDDSDQLTRLRALATLTVLEQPVPTRELWSHCMGTQRTREASARLVYECADQYECPGVCGTELLVWDGSESMTIYGLDTLVKLNDGAGTPLLEVARKSAGSWSDAVLIQVCRVLEHIRATNPDDASFDWLIALFEHQQPAVRAAAIRALKQQGWRTGLRQRIDVNALLEDDSPQVRRATYNVLAYWGDSDAQSLLEQAMISERETRCQLAAVRAVRSLDMDPLKNHSGWPVDAWNWVRAVETADVDTPLDERSGLS